MLHIFGGNYGIKSDNMFIVFDDEDLTLEEVEGWDIYDAIINGVQVAGYPRTEKVLKNGSVKYDVGYEYDYYHEHPLVIKSIGLAVKVQKESVMGKYGMTVNKVLLIWYNGFIYRVGEISRFNGGYFDKKYNMIRLFISSLVGYESSYGGTYYRQKYTPIHFNINNITPEAIQIGNNIIKGEPMRFEGFMRQLLLG